MVIEGYSLLNKLYSDGSFDFFQAIELSSNAKVCLKIPKNENKLAEKVSTLNHEFNLVKNLQIPGIINAINMLEDEEVTALVFEQVKGIPLPLYVTSKPIDLSTFLEYALQLVDIIGSLHELDIILEEINPKHIFVNDGALMLTNLSSGKQLADKRSEYIAPIGYKHISHYSAPEQTGKINRQIDYRTNFYTLGVIFFEMLTGRLPFRSNDHLELIHYIVAKPAPLATDFNKNIPRMVALIIQKLLSKMPEDRYKSCIGLKEDLLTCQAQWQETGKINNFKLGVKDVNDHLIISHRLYGRKKQVDVLLNAFGRVAHGYCELLLIAGYAGIGKTSLVKQVHKPIVQRKGYFIQGKYDQLQSTIPYSAITAAFKLLVRQVLALKEEQLEKIKINLLKALDNMGQVVIDVIPDVELIIGKQPKLPVLNPAETAHRFNLVLTRFIQVFASAESPVVLFLDDLQWVDSGSLNFIENLLTQRDAHHLLILGAYRNNEVGRGHILSLFLRNLEKKQIAIENLALEPLKIKDLTHLLIDTFNTKTNIEQFASLLYEKTRGNPFFFNVFLKMLNQEKFLFFNYDKSKWEWDCEKIKQQSVTENVIDLLTVRINQLSPETQEILKMGSFFGYTFDLDKLMIVSKQAKKDLAMKLGEAVVENLIIEMKDIKALFPRESYEEEMEMDNIFYRFAHDRIQQAAYELIPKEKRARVHLHIGRLLIKEKELQQDDDRLLEIMDHFNSGLNLITDLEERQQLALYNFWAGLKVKKSSAYESAREYFQAADILLKSLDWESNYHLRFGVLKELAVCKYLTGKFLEAEKTFKWLSKHANNVLDKIEIQRLRCEMLSTMNKHDEAIKLGLKALKYANINIPTNPSLARILIAIYKIKLKIGRRKIIDIELHPIQNELQRAAINLITQLFNNAFIANQRLFVLLTCTNIYLSLKHGYAESNSMSLPAYAFVLMHFLNMYEEGMNFIKLNERLTEKFGEANFEGKKQFVLGTFVEPWRTEAKKLLDILTKSLHLSYNSGDLVYANYCNLVLTNTSFFIGKSLNEFNYYLQATRNLIAKANIKDFSLMASFWELMRQNLEGEKDYSSEEINIFEKEFLKSKAKTERYFFYSECAKLAYLEDDYATTIKCGEKYRDYAEYGTGIITNVEYLLYYFLALTSQYQTAGWMERIRISFLLYKIRRRITRWAKWCPKNFESYRLLIEAEFAALHKNRKLATTLFEQAIEKASREGFALFTAVIYERAANFYREDELDKLAQFYYSEAFRLYQEYGAINKCHRMEKLYPSIQEKTTLDATKTEIDTAPSIDMLAILKSAEIISSEIHLDKLRKKLLLIVLEIAAAEHAVIIARKSKHWFIEAEGNIELQKIFLGEEEELNEHRLPLSLINYVQHTQQPLIVHESTHSELTFSDSYVQERKPRSMLVLPIMFQGQLSRILYLENRNSSHVFNTNNLQSLQLIASSAMISLENAKLYHQASHDPLTGLANRNLLDQVYKISAGQAQRMGNQLVLFFIDLDNFKIINDTLGHEIGDKILRWVGNNINKSLREGDLAARLGGDEFAILLSGIKDIKQITDIADRLYQFITQPITILSHKIQITFSMGICVFPKDGTEIHTLLKLADIALYQAKESGKNQYYFYSPTLQEQNRQLHLMEADLYTALQKNEFRMYYQPIVSIKDKKIVSIEALLRWEHPKKGLINATDFIHILEKKALILPVSEWIINSVCQQVKHWQSKGLLNIPVAINTSAFQFSKQSISRLLAENLSKYRLKPECFELELTESTFMENHTKVIEEIQALIHLGIKLVIDDFGTGYSSLAYLKRLPLSKLKIDQSFFHKGSNADFDLVILSSITTLAHQLKLEVIAEGIENKEQYDIARKLGIDAVQGFYCSYPLSAEELEECLLQKKAS